MHPRNIYRTPPDFKQLAIDFEEFRNVSQMVRIHPTHKCVHACENRETKFQFHIFLVEHQWQRSHRLQKWHSPTHTDAMSAKERFQFGRNTTGDEFNSNAVATFELYSVDRRYSANTRTV